LYEKMHDPKMPDGRWHPADQVRASASINSYIFQRH
jgi:hypothetical protein